MAEIDQLLRKTKNDRDWRQENYLKYLGVDLPIQYRTFDDETKVNNKIENPFRAEIVDQVVGYVFGNPIAYSLEGEYSEAQQKINDTYFRRFLTRNTIADLDAETGTKMSATGKAFRLAYIDEDGYERLANLPPHECLVIENSEGESTIGLWEYWIENTESEKDWYLEFYDEKYTHFYEWKGGTYVKADERAHGFDYCPLIQFKNNEQMFPDFYRVESLIDAYDRLTSDSQNELEEFRLAYMYFKGFEVDPEDAKDAKEAGGFEIPEDGDIGFITKQVNDTFLDNHKRTLAENIYKFSKSVDMSDEKFSGGAQTGESRKWKLLTLENRAIVKERKFNKALRYQWKVLSSSWRKRDINIDYLDIEAQFTRNVPVELSHEAEIQKNLYGLISEEKRLSLFSPIEDVQQEIERLEEQAQQSQIEDFEDDGDAQE